MNIIRAALKGLHSPDVYDLEAYKPENENCFGFLLRAMFGPEDADGEESFDMIVCTPEWLGQEVKKGGVVNGRHHLIVDEFDINKVRSFLVDYGH